MLREELGDAATLPKRGMKERFGLLRLKADGSPAKVAQVPPMQVLHTDPMFRPEWIDYSALDAKATWNVHRALRRKLQGNEALLDEYLCERLAETGRPEYVSALHSTHALQAAEAADEAAARAAADAAQRAAQGAAAATPAPQISANGPQRRGAWPRPGHHRPPGSGALPGAAPQPLQQQPPPPPQPARVASSFTMWRLYEDYWRPFGQLLTDMEAAGVRVDRHVVMCCATLGNDGVGGMRMESKGGGVGATMGLSGRVPCVCVCLGLPRRTLLDPSCSTRLLACSLHLPSACSARTLLHPAVCPDHTEAIIHHTHIRPPSTAFTGSTCVSRKRVQLKTSKLQRSRLGNGHSGEESRAHAHAATPHAYCTWPCLQGDTPAPMCHMFALHVHCYCAASPAISASNPLHRTVPSPYTHPTPTTNRNVLTSVEAVHANK